MPGAKRRAAKAAVAAAGAAKRRTTTSAQRELQGAPSYNAGRPTRPGPQASALPGTQPLPKRNAKNELVFADHPELRPNLTPAQVLQLGSFGGTYFRPIDSGTTGKRESDAWKEFPKEWFAGLDVKKCARHSPCLTVVAAAPRLCLRFDSPCDRWMLLRPARADRRRRVAQAGHALDEQLRPVREQVRRQVRRLAGHVGD